MKNKIFLSLLFIASNSLADNLTYKDFGTFGKTYPILEENFFDFIKREAKKIKIDKKDIEKIVVEQVKNAAYETTTLPLCQKDLTEPRSIDYYTVKTDIKNPFGRVIYAKGQKIESKIKNGRSLDLCFIDGRNDIVTSNQINFFKKRVNNCLFIVSNKNTLKLRKKFPDTEIYPTSKMQEDRFSLGCYPAHFHFKGKYIDKKYFSYEQFKN